MLARARGRLRDCGADLAAHCINDVAHVRRRRRSCCSTTSPPTRSTSTRSPSSSRAPPRSAATAGVALVGGETAELPGIYARRRARLRRHLRRHRRRAPTSSTAATIDGRRRRDRLRVGRRARERLHARAPRARGRGLRRRPTCSRRPASTSTWRARLRGRAKAFAHVTGGGILGQPRAACCPDGRAAPSSTGTRGRARRSSSGSRATSTRRSCGASSTSASAGAPSSREPQPGEIVIGRIA